MIVALLLLVAVVSMVLGGIVIFQQPKVPAAVLFFITMIAVAVWSCGLAIFLESSSPSVLLEAAKYYYVAAAMIGWSTLCFSLTFVRHELKRSTLELAYVTLPFVLLATIIILQPRILVLSVSVGEVNTALLSSSMYTVYAAYFAIYYLGALGVLFHRSRKRNQQLRKHFMYIFVAYCIAGAVGMLFNLFLPFFGNYQLIWVGPLGLLLFVPILFIAIAKHGLFDIRRAVIRSVAYVISLITLAVVYYLLVYLVSATLFQNQTTSSVSVNPINIALALILAFIFQPIKRFFDRITDRIFFRDRYDTGEFFARLSELLTTTTDLRNLLRRSAYEISATLKSEWAYFVVRYGDTKHLTIGTSRHKNLPVSDGKVLDEYVAQKGGEVIIANMLEGHTKISRILLSHQIALLLPLVHKNIVVGYLVLGDQQGSTYTNRDVRVLKTVSDELVIAIQNALSVQQVKDINANLEQRIDAATAELRTSNARLRRLDAAKDEFLSMVSHQLRTPLTSVKGYLSMVLEEDVGRITKTQRKLLAEAFTSSERMVHLIHDFLNVSRLQTGSFMLERNQYDLRALVEREITSLKQVAASRSITLKFVDTVGPLMMNIDETKLQQVVMNYIDNAIYYSHPNTAVTIELAKTKSNITLKVKDTGIGVPVSEQAQLFSKFYRASNARKQRPDGTGVGLYLAQKVVSAHGGKVLFESKEGRGSTFGFQLPLKDNTN